MNLENVSIVPTNVSFVYAWRLGKVTERSKFNWRIENMSVYRNGSVDEYESIFWYKEEIVTITRNRDRYIILKDGI